VAILAFGGGARAHGQTETGKEFWPEADIFFRLNDTARILFVAAMANNRDVENREAEFSAFLDIFVPRFRPVLFRRISDLDDARARRIVLRGGYRYVRSLDADAPAAEHRLQTDATLRWALPAHLLTSFRGRAEYRFEDEFSWRFRNELKFERDRIGRYPVTPYASAEMFYGSNFDTISRWRYTAGIVFTVGSHWAVEPYYTRQIAKHPEFRTTNAAGLTVSLYGP
jgi:hypothetical protein